ncbi:MAG: type II toxin-antitoxin system RelE/ParE family toxin [Candidatus Micrarchaeota archaeon]
MSEMYFPEDTPNFKKKMKKLCKKDRVRFERVRRKVQEVLKNPHICKPLGNVMAGIRSVHIDPFVFTFSIDEKKKIVKFLDYEHHDKIYGS